MCKDATGMGLSRCGCLEGRALNEEYEGQDDSKPSAIVTAQRAFVGGLRHHRYAVYGRQV